LQGRDTDYTPLSSAEVTNTWSYTFTPPYIFKSWSLVNDFQCLPSSLEFCVDFVDFVVLSTFLILLEN